MPSTKKKLTPKQSEIAALIEANQTITVEEIGTRLGVSTNAIYGSVKTMRDNKTLPAAWSPSKAQPSTEHKVAVTGARESVEEHIKGELAGVTDRLRSIAEAQEQLAKEQDELTLRQSQLSAASTALERPLAAVSAAA